MKTPLPFCPTLEQDIQTILGLGDDLNVHTKFPKLGILTLDVLQQDALTGSESSPFPYSMPLYTFPDFAQLAQYANPANNTQNNGKPTTINSSIGAIALSSLNEPTAVVAMSCPQSETDDLLATGTFANATIRYTIGYMEYTTGMVEQELKNSPFQQQSVPGMRSAFATYPYLPYDWWIRTTTASQQMWSSSPSQSHRVGNYSSDWGGTNSATNPKSQSLQEDLQEMPSFCDNSLSPTKYIYSNVMCLGTGSIEFIAKYMVIALEGVGCVSKQCNSIFLAPKINFLNNSII